VDGADNDLNDRVDALVQRVVGDEQSVIYAFGEPWINENKKDKVFGFLPGNGVHDIHMNQGDLTGDHSQEDGVYQDGGLLFYLAATNQFVAYFTKFQSQSWHTDDATGHAISGEGEQLPPNSNPGSTPQPGGAPSPGGGNPVEPGGDPDFQVQIIAALVNPAGPAPEKETVTLLNTTTESVELAGWSLADKQKNKMTLSGAIAAGGTLQIAAKAPLQLSNAGGIITLLNPQGIKVHGVSYTKSQAKREGITITFP
jgi:hypothetical protein